MVWLVFALLSNVFFSFVNIIDQLLRRNHVKHDVSLTLLWVVSFFFIWLAIVPFIDVTVPELPKLAAALVAGFIAVLVALPYYYSLSVEEVSKVMPIWQFSSLFVLVMSALFLGEKLLIRHYYGFAAIFGGGLLLGLTKTVKGFRLNKAVLVVSAASIAWAVHLVLVKFFYASENFWNGFFWIYVGSFFGAAFLALLPGNFGHLKKQVSVLTKKGVALLLAATGLTFLAELSFLFAIKKGPVALVSVVGGTQLMFLFVMTVIISKYFPNILKERIDRKALLTKSAAICLMVLGLYLVR